MFQIQQQNALKYQTQTAELYKVRRNACITVTNSFSKCNIQRCNIVNTPLIGCVPNFIRISGIL